VTASDGPATLDATVIATIPAEWQRTDSRCDWSAEVLGTDRVGSFLEGPCVAPDGGLYFSDLAHGRIFHVGPDGTLTTVLDYDGQPNGLALHADGQLFVADYRRGLLALDPETGDLRLVCGGYRMEPFRGLSDLVFGPDGTLYFSDQGQSDLRFPTGRLFRWSAAAGPELLMDAIASPNGVALSPDGQVLYVAVTRANCVYRVPLRADGSVGKIGVYLQLSGGHGGPDGLACDAAGGLAIARYGLGAVQLFDALGQLVLTVRSPSGTGTTNAAFGGPDGRTLLVTEAHSGSVLSVQVDQPGLPLYGQMAPGPTAAELSAS
jgi:gluconolactonase